MAECRNIWSEAMTLALLDEYERNEYLWNAFHPSYTNKQKREEAYARMIAALASASVTLKDVKIKLKNLRSSYSGELKKIRDARVGGEKEYSPKVFWFHKMDAFLRDVVVPQHTTYDDYQGPIYGTNEEYPASDPIASKPLCSKLVTKKRRLVTRHNPAPRLNKVIKKEETQDVSHVHILEDRNTHREEDEFDAFGRNMAHQLRTLPLDIALQMQIKLQSMLAEVRLSLTGQHHRVDFGDGGSHYEFDLSNHSDDLKDNA